MEGFENAIVNTTVDNVHKDQCAFSFDTTMNCADGLYVCMACFIGVGRDFLEMHNTTKGHNLFLRIKKTVTKKKAKRNEEGESLPKRLVIENDEEIVTSYFISKYPSCDIMEVPVDTENKAAQSFMQNTQVPENVRKCVSDIISMESAERKEKIEAWTSGANLCVSQYATNLIQERGPIYSNDHKTWKCQHEGCTVTGNLWLNLHDGSMLCGRKNELCEGNNHSLEHYKELSRNGKDYSLVVKMGTIQPGEADVYSYSEDDMVLDVYLEEHIATYGLTMSKLTKTSKAMAELELEQNLAFESRLVLFGEEKAESISGPQIISIHNDGNTCYVASIIQMLFVIPEIAKYFDDPERIRKTFVESVNPHDDLKVQMHRIGRIHLIGVCPNEGISPSRLKWVSGFLGNEQQDCVEFLMSFCSRLKQAYVDEPLMDINKLLYYTNESRIFFENTYVSYNYSRNLIFNVSVSRDMALNLKEVNEFEEKLASCQPKERSGLLENPILPIIPFSACLDATTFPEFVEDFTSPVTKKSVMCEKSNAFSSFPPYLCVCLKRFEVSPTYEVKKICAKIDVPEHLDLERFRAKNEKDGIITIASSGEEKASAKVSADPATVAALEAMGFSHARSVRAVRACGALPERAAEWAIENMDDPGMDDPLPEETVQTALNENDIEILMQMGFLRWQAIQALKQCGNIESAAEFLLMNADGMVEIEESIKQEKSEPEITERKPNADSSQYELIGFVTHLGSSPKSGHYIAHFKLKRKDDKDFVWISANDDKITVCTHVPKELGYLYLFRRIDK